MTPTFVMAVPWDQRRVRRARELQVETGATIIWDRIRDPLDTFQLFLRSAMGGPAILLEDDVVLTGGWRGKVEKVIADRPGQVCQFFTMGSEEKERRLGSREEPGRTFVGNLCVYLPEETIPGILDYAERWSEIDPVNKTAQDYVIRRWLQDNKLRYWVQAPSLVQHEPWVSTINSRRPRNRRSKWVDES